MTVARALPPAAALALLLAVCWMGGGGAADRAVLLAFREPADLGDPLGPDWLEEAARDVTALGSTPVVLLVAALAWLALSVAGRRGDGWRVLLAVGGGQMLSVLLKLALARARPDLVPHAARVFTSGFPSGHALLSAVTYLSLGAVGAGLAPTRRLRAVFLGLAVAVTLAVGASRIYLGVHWPSDVLAGWALGAAWALFAGQLLTRSISHRT